MSIRFPRFRRSWTRLTICCPDFEGRPRPAFRVDPVTVVNHTIWAETLAWQRVREYCRGRVRRGERQSGTPAISAVDSTKSRRSDSRADIKSLFYVLIVGESDQGVNVRSDPNLIDAKIKVRFPQRVSQPLPSECQIGVSLERWL
jgi:hypothetical protein